MLGKQLKILGTQATKAVTILILVLGPISVAANAQTYSVLYNFTGGQDGATPKAGVTLDQAGNLYGTAWQAGSVDGECSTRLQGRLGCGTVFELKHTGSGWVLNLLYTFHFDDGASPYSRAVFGPNGLLYGTTGHGGNDPQGACGTQGYGCGVVFALSPPATICRNVSCPWAETVLFKFGAGPSGCEPLYGDVVFDPGGNMYGTGLDCGFGQGVVWELTPSDSGWTESVPHEFATAPAISVPFASVTIDPAGNLYGTAIFNGQYGKGGVFELTPSSSGWIYSEFYDFSGENDGAIPRGGLIRDQAGNLYGTTFTAGANGGGTVYEFSPSNGGWTLTTLYSFSGGGGPYAVLTMDAAGNLYGTTLLDGAYGQGNVFKLTPSNGSWTYTSLHDFTGGSDGGQPFGQVTLDANGNLYGTASIGGASNKGVVWEITP